MVIFVVSLVNDSFDGFVIVFEVDVVIIGVGFVGFCVVCLFYEVGKWVVVLEVRGWVSMFLYVFLKKLMSNRLVVRFLLW